jgi:hypothetical protein
MVYQLHSEHYNSKLQIKNSRTLFRQPIPK